MHEIFDLDKLGKIQINWNLYAPAIRHIVFFSWLTKACAMVPEGHIVLMYSIYSVFC